MDGIGLDQGQVADAINRKYQGMSQRERNQKMAQAQSGGASQFQSQYGNELAQAQQPTEFWGAGRKLAENQAPDMSAVTAGGGFLSNLGGEQYYYGNKDPSKYSFGNQQDLWSNLENQYRSKYAPSLTKTLNQQYKNTLDSGIMSQQVLDNQVAQGNMKQYDDVYLYDGKTYADLNQANTALNSTLSSYKSLAKAQQSELLGQLFTQGKITGQFEPTVAPERQFDNLGFATGAWEDYISGKNVGRLGGNSINDVISGDLMKLFGSKDLMYDGQLQGTAFDMGGYDPVKKQWDEKWSDSHSSIWGSNKTNAWDQGFSQVGRSLNDPNWWNQNSTNLGDGYSYLAKDKVGSAPGWSNVDQYIRNKGEQELKKGMVQQIWEKTSPTHLIAKQEFKDMQPIGEMVGNAFIPGLGSLINAVDAFSVGNPQGGTQGLARAGISYGSSTYGGDTGAPVDTATSTTGQAANGMASNGGGVFGTGFSLGSLTADKALQAAISGTGSALVSGGDPKSVLANALLTGAGGYSGDTIAKLFGNKVLGGIAGGAMKGAVTGLRDPEHMLESALTSGAAGGLGGIFNEGVSNPTQRQSNAQMANQTVNLAKLFAKGKK